VAEFAGLKLVGWWHEADVKQKMLDVLVVA
jgi:hypothetical protein